MPASADFRRAARGHLKGAYLTMIAAFGALLCALILLSVLEDFARSLWGVSSLPLFDMIDRADFWGQYWPDLCVTLGAALLSLFLYQPLLLGMRRLFWRAANDGSIGLSGLFADFSSGRRYARALLFSLLLYLRYILCALLMLPGLALCALGGGTALNGIRTSLPDGALNGIATVFGVVLALLGFVLFVRLILRYFLARVFFVNDDSLAPRDAVRLSVRAMKGYKGELVSLVLSYVGWLLLCVLVLPLIYVAPYFAMGYTSYARFVIEDNARKGRLSATRGPSEPPSQGAELPSPAPEPAAATRIFPAVPQ